MTAKENIEEKLHNLGSSIGSDKKLVENVMSRIEAEPDFGNSNNKIQNIWRIIMKNPITKLAAAAVVIIAVFFGLLNVKLSNPAYGISDVPKIMENSRTIHLKGWQSASVKPGLYDPNIVQLYEKETRTLLEYWIDMETGASKTTEPSHVIVEGKKLRIFSYTKVYDGKFLMEINDEKKTVSFIKFSPYQQLLRKKKNTATILTSLLPILDSSGSYKNIGQEKINEETFDIWQTEVNVPAPAIKDNKIRIKVWLCPDNGHLGKFEMWMQTSGTSMLQMLELNQIEYNVPIPDGTFATEIPEGYSSVYSKETAPVNQLVQNSTYYFYDKDKELVRLKLTSHACFTLNDGSVILGWSCTFDKKAGSEAIAPEADNYQEEIYRGLVAGGELPKLHMVFYTVSPYDETLTLKYYGRHLTYTKKDNVFYEWSIYVPEKKLDYKYYGQLGYHLRYKNNLKDINKEGAITLGEIGDIQVGNENDFNIFVLGAMAELSDDGKTPSDVTYEKTLRFAQQIRASAKK